MFAEPVPRAVSVILGLPEESMEKSMDLEVICLSSLRRSKITLQKSLSHFIDSKGSYDDGLRWRQSQCSYPY